jgi:hypothetical protein
MRMSLSPPGRQKGEAGVLLLAGAELPVGACKFMELNPRAGPSRGTGLPGVCKTKESPHANCVTKENTSFARIVTFETCFFASLSVIWKTHTCDGTESTASRAEVNGPEVLESATNVPYYGDERLHIGK